MGRPQPMKKITPDMEKKLRPWRPEFWESLMGKCPGKAPEDGDDAAKITPEKLWDLACLYFAGEMADTMIKKDFIRSGESAGKVVEMTTTRPFSWNSFGLFALYHNVKEDVHSIRLNQDNKYNDFKEVVAKIDQVIYQQKFDGAAIGEYNPQLVIRDLGLAEKVDASVKQEQPLFVDAPQPPTDSE